MGFFHISFLMVVLQTVADESAPNVTDGSIERAIQEYADLCPYTDLCLSNSKDTFPRLSPVYRQKFTACCKACMCEEPCGTSCCPDGNNSYVSDEQIQLHNQNMSRCIRLQYRNSELNATMKGPAYYTVSTCPDGYPDNSIKYKCNQDYHDFEFTEDVTNFVPVSNGITVYKNKQCAICNGVSIEDLEFWDMQIICQHPAIFPAAHNFVEIKNAVESIEKCDIFFNPSPNTSKHSLCIPMIDRCNVTGRWRRQDIDIERACMSYTSVYHGQYKNVHCYLCNTEDPADVPTICEKEESSSFIPNSFIALLDFQGLLESPEAMSRKSTNCPEDHFYDPVKEACRLLVCPEYMYIRDGTCRPLFLSLRDHFATVYDVVVTLEPRTAFRESYLRSGSVETIYYSLWYNVENALKALDSQFSLCQIFGFIFLRNTILGLIDNFTEDDRQHLMLSEIESFAFRLTINGVMKTEFNDELTLLDNLFMSYDKEPGLLPYTLRFRIIPLDMFDNALDMMGVYQKRGNPAVDHQLNLLKLDEVLQTAFGAGFYDEESGFTIAPLYNGYPFNTKTCNPIAEFQPNPSCPKVQLSEDEFNVTDDGIVINEERIFLQNQDVIFTLNSTVLICYEAYKSVLNTSLAPDHETTIFIMEPVVIITTVSLCLSITSLAVSFIVYALLPSLRSLPGLNIMALIGSLFVTHLLTLLNGLIKIQIGKLCVAFGFALHFSILMSTFWMFICTFHVAQVFLKQELSNPRITSKSRQFTRYLGLAIIMSGVFVAINVTVRSVTLNKVSLGYDPITCYLDSTEMVLFTVAIPVGSVVVTNIAMFIAVAVKLGRIPSVKLRRNVERNNVAIFAKLSTITGMTWTFGFLYQFTSNEVFAYIFVLLNASQGVFIMVAFILNRRVASMLKTRFNDSLKCSSSKSTMKTAK